MPKPNITVEYMDYITNKESECIFTRNSQMSDNVVWSPLNSSLFWEYCFFENRKFPF